MGVFHARWGITVPTGYEKGIKTEFRQSNIILFINVILYFLLCTVLFVCSMTFEGSTRKAFIEA